MRKFYIEFEGRMYYVEKGKETNVFLEDHLILTTSEDLPDEKIKGTISTLVNI